MYNIKLRSQIVQQKYHVHNNQPILQKLSSRFNTVMIIPLFKVLSLDHQSHPHLSLVIFLYRSIDTFNPFKANNNIFNSPTYQQQTSTSIHRYRHSLQYKSMIIPTQFDRFISHLLYQTNNQCQYRTRPFILYYYFKRMNQIVLLFQTLHPQYQVSNEALNKNLSIILCYYFKKWIKLPYSSRHQILVPQVSNEAPNKNLCSFKCILRTIYVR
eukprot:TRINITY_DN77518_c0_g1_i7.p1 TRINITY_DN77518_c0_g1~~TRINITY_DN77518_c0_g1_i7.p1  ORF type:complete len:213 (+),score=-25.86 TRINITY_DN77518_c0_g1_i7:105-743(+)